MINDFLNDFDNNTFKIINVKNVELTESNSQKK